MQLAQIAAGASAVATPAPVFVPYEGVTNKIGASVLTGGAVVWSVACGGSSTTVSATIANVNGQPFYLARLLFEMRAVPTTTAPLLPVAVVVGRLAASAKCGWCNAK